MAAEKLLVVDDDRTTAAVIQLYLEKLEFIVVGVAFSGAEAVEKVRLLKPDLVLMDIRLGQGLDGIETAGLIMNHFHTPVVYVTAYNDDRTFKRAQATNPHGYINKPIRETDLKTTIGMALGKDKSVVETNRKETPTINQALRQIYGLTPAESRVVSQLINDPSVEVASEALHISISTIRTHLKHIYRKTDTHSQTALIHKIITGSAAMVSQLK